MTPDTDPYRTLGLSRGATLEEVRRARQALRVFLQLAQRVLERSPARWRIEVGRQARDGLSVDLELPVRIAPRGKHEERPP